MFSAITKGSADLLSQKVSRAFFALNIGLDTIAQGANRASLETRMNKTALVSAIILLSNGK